MISDDYFVQVSRFVDRPHPAHMGQRSGSRIAANWDHHRPSPRELESVRID